MPLDQPPPASARSVRAPTSTHRHFAQPAVLAGYQAWLAGGPAVHAASEQLGNRSPLADPGGGMPRWPTPGHRRVGCFEHVCDPCPTDLDTLDVKLPHAAFFGYAGFDMNGLFAGGGEILR